MVFIIIYFLIAIIIFALIIIIFKTNIINIDDFGGENNNAVIFALFLASIIWPISLLILIVINLFISDIFSDDNKDN